MRGRRQVGARGAACTACTRARVHRPCHRRCPPQLQRLHAPCTPPQLAPWLARARAGEGLITYMRTDGVTLSPEATAAVRQSVGSHFGKELVAEQPRCA